MHNSFEGDFRRKPQVSIRGSSKVESKEELLIRAQQERQKREVSFARLSRAQFELSCFICQVLRVQRASAIKIQRVYRAFTARKRLWDDLRRSFDELKTKYKAGDNDVKVTLSRQLLLFFDPAIDSQRMSWLCQVLVAERGDLVKCFTDSSNEWPFRMARLLKATVNFMANTSDKISSAFRFLEIYSSPETYDDSNRIMPILYRYLMSQNYFGYARQVCDARIPPLLQETSKPPTPHAEAVLAMIYRPIHIITSFNGISEDIR